MPLVYEVLRRLAAQKVAQEAPGQTLQPTALVHEAYLRLFGTGEKRHWDSRGHFFAAAVEAMRRILVENPRRKRSHKRGGGRVRQDADPDHFPVANPHDPLEVLVTLHDGQPVPKVIDSRSQPRLSRLVHGELDWIVMRCLEKDRTRRYEMASGLAHDLQHYLADEPVEACPPTAGYRLRKFAGRIRSCWRPRPPSPPCSCWVWRAARGRPSGRRRRKRWRWPSETRRNKPARPRPSNETPPSSASRLRNRNATRRQQQRDEAQQQRDEVRALNDRLQRTLYAADMNLARHAWEEAAVTRVQELLEQHRPKPGEIDLRGFEWRYLYRLCHQEILTLKGHTGNVKEVAFSPDGKRLASTSMDNTVKVWDAQTGQELLSLRSGIRGYMGPVAFSPDGKRLASPGGGGVKVWDAQTGQELLTLKGANNNPASSLAFSPDGNRLAIASYNQTVRIWDATPLPEKP